MNEDALRRIEDTLGQDVIERITSLPGADVTTVLLEIARRRAESLSPSDVLRRYETDRFVHPGTIDPEIVRRIEDTLSFALPEGFDRLALSPIAPFGAHGLAGVDQSRVITTVRSNEVAADPTNVLALEAAVRRRQLLRADARSSTVVRLTASQRVTRAQLFEGEGVFSHFQLLGLVTAGRDTGEARFEREAIVEHVAYAADAIHRVTGAPAVIELTDLTGGAMSVVADEIRRALPAGIIEDRPDREAGRDYYDRMCFKAYATTTADRFEVADGGLVDWTQKLVPSRKERLMISGLGVERLAMTLEA